LGEVHLALFRKCGIKLIGLIFKGDAVHQKNVEAVINSVVDVVADLSVFGAFSDDSGGQMAGFLAEVPSRLGNDCEVLVLGKSEDLLLGLREGGGGVAASEIEDLHLVPVLLADLHADGGDVDGLSEAFAAVLAAAAVEVQAVQVDSHLLDLLEPHFGLLDVVQVVAEFVGEDGRQVLRLLFFNRDSPEDLHFRSHLLDFEQFVDAVGGRIANPFAVSIVYVRFNFN